jgi:hypothetical protein
VKSKAPPLHRATKHKVDSSDQPHHLLRGPRYRPTQEARRWAMDNAVCRTIPGEGVEYLSRHAKDGPKPSGPLSMILSRARVTSLPFSRVGWGNGVGDLQPMTPTQVSGRCPGRYLPASTTSRNDPAVTDRFGVESLGAESRASSSVRLLGPLCRGCPRPHTIATR